MSKSMPFTRGRRRLFLLRAGLLPLSVLLPLSLRAQEHGMAGHGAAPAAPAAGAKPARKPRPQLASGAALAPDGAVWMAMLDAQGRLVTQRSADLGRSWSAARPLDIGDEKPSADGENHPKIAFGPRGQVAISYTRPLSKPFTGEIRLLHSSDGGAHFSPPATVHQDRQEITHRFESIAFDGQGRLHVVWIDKRDLELAKKAGRDYEGAAIYRNVSADGGASFGADQLLAANSCECCRIALAPDAQGRLAAFWRHVWPGQVRDHGFARLEEGAAVQRASQDGWVVAGCPHHGGDLTAASDGGWHAVWFGVRDGVGVPRYGRLSAEGRPQGPARMLPDEAAEHAALARAGRRLAISWRSFDGQRMRWRAWVSEDEGRSFTLRELGHTTGASDYARLLSDGRRLIALWRCDGEPGARLVEL
ncbi:MAG: hypothetical protein C0423_14685 [Methylibium sp.]|nr:hypothetical protein [Methylibium sp.]